MQTALHAWGIRKAERCFGAIQHQNKRAATSVLVSVSELEKAGRIPPPPHTLTRSKYRVIFIANAL